jgi:hypothetical protein
MITTEREGGGQGNGLYLSLRWGGLGRLGWNGGRRRRGSEMGIEAGQRPPTGRDTSVMDGDRRCRLPIADGNGEVKHGAVRGDSPKCIYFLEHFCYCFSSNLCVLNATNAD